MTLNQSEKYLILEVENLHIKFDSAVESLGRQIQELMKYFAARFDSLEKSLNIHEERLKRIEKSV